MSAEAKPLGGLRVLVPRGGTWGDLVSKALREQGAHTVIAPLVDFSHTSEEDKLVEALKELEAGRFDWMTATSSTVADVLAHHNAVIPPETKVAVVGEATAVAFRDAGYHITRTPVRENSTHALLEEWSEIDTDERLRVLTLRSDVAIPVLTQGLMSRGHDVTQVLAFRTVGVPASVHIREDIESGRINALLVASAKIAEQVAEQFPELSEDTIVACAGANTLEAAAALGLPTEADDPAHPLYASKRALIETVESVIDQSDMLD
ncbi:uroporphyrinogen-III synthase [Leucobacter triazinivorans]|uniref:Uroporphyrinogen-III synthase n=1 Tax=Leucobacter triazinivorans TaxID=1784719 RepID=A0A4P6KED4_9MICO|nr:uroporphyrinogen-III synthase [Leucobacter triazinivorans]